VITLIMVSKQLGGPMGYHIRSITSNLKSAAGKLALGISAFAILTLVGSTTIVGATPVTGNTQAEGTTSQQKQSEDSNNKDHQKNSNNGDRGEKGNKDHNKNKGDHGYGGNNNATHTDITANQSGHDNVFNVIINYIFG